MSLLNLSLLALTLSPADAATPAEMDSLVDGAGFVRVEPLDVPDLPPVTISRTMLPPDLSAVSSRGTFTPAHLGQSRQQQRAALTHGDKLFLQFLNRVKFARKGPKNTPRRRRAALNAANGPTN